MQTLRKLPMQAPSAKARLSTSQPPSSAGMGSGDMLDSTAGTVSPASRMGQTRGGTKRSGGPTRAPSRPGARAGGVMPVHGPARLGAHRPATTAPRLDIGRYQE